MAVFIPDPDLSSFDDLIEELGAQLAARYSLVETVLVEAAARRMRRILVLEQLGAEAEAVALQQRAMRDLELERAASLAELRRVAQEQVARIRREGLAEQIIATASQAGQAAAAAQLAGIRTLANRSIGTTAATAAAALTVELASKLDVLNARITRFPDDVYKQIMSEHSPRIILGAQTTRQAQAAAIQTFLGQGIGHIDYLRKDGSVHLRMPIGSYAEMAGRTSAQRAWQEASIARMQQSGVDLGTIAGSLDACAKCAPWIGSVVSFDGTRGVVTLSSAADGGAVTVQIKGTVDDARSAGWGHPNCRDRIVAYLPGATRVPDPVQYDPASEKERAGQRSLEREIRAAKRREASAMNDVDQRRASSDVRDAQANMRDFIERTGRHRQSAREQLGFAGTANRTAFPTSPSSLPEPPNA